MIAMDRTVKLLLGAIVILLGTLVIRGTESKTDELPIRKISSTAHADTVTAATPTSTTTSFGFREAQISIINIPRSNTVKEVFPIEGTGCFGIRYDHHVEVYSVVQATNESKIRPIQTE